MFLTTFRLCFLETSHFVTFERLHYLTSHNIAIKTASETGCGTVQGNFPKQALVFTCLQYKSFKNSVGKGEIAPNKQFLAPLAEGQQAIVMVLCPSCVHPAIRLSVRPSVCAPVNSSFKKLPLRNY